MDYSSVIILAVATAFACFTIGAVVVEDTGTASAYEANKDATAAGALLGILSFLTVISIGILMPELAKIV